MTITQYLQGSPLWSGQPFAATQVSLTLSLQENSIYWLKTLTLYSLSRQKIWLSTAVPMCNKTAFSTFKPFFFQALYLVILTKWFWNESFPQVTGVLKSESYMRYFVMNPEYPLIYLDLVRRVCHRYQSRNILGFEEERWPQSEAHKQLLLHPHTAFHSVMHPWFL